MKSPTLIKMAYQDMVQESYKDRFPSLTLRQQGRDSILDNIINRQFQHLSNVLGGIELAILRERQS